jgi:hypothetical protein
VTCIFTWLTILECAMPYMLTAEQERPRARGGYARAHDLCGHSGGPVLATRADGGPRRRALCGPTTPCMRCVSLEEMTANGRLRDDEAR